MAPYLIVKEGRDKWQDEVKLTNIAAERAKKGK